MNHGIKSALASALGFFAMNAALAQGCVEVPIPFTEFEISSNPSNLGDAISQDGSQVFMQAVPLGAAANAGAEVFIFNPRTRTTQQLTQGTLATADFRGDSTKYPTHFFARSNDERYLLTQSSAAPSFPFLVLPGQTQASQVEAIEGIPGPAVVIDVMTGAKTVLGSLPNQSLAPGQIYISTLSNLTASTVTVNESIVSTITQRATNGRDYRIVTGRVGTASAAYTIANGQIVSPQPSSIYSRMVAKTGVPNFAPTAFQISGDGNAVSFYTNRNLEDPQRRFLNQLANNTSQLYFNGYVYYGDTDEIKPIAPVSFSGPARPANGSSNAVFVRNIGRTGKIFALDRGANYIGAPANPTYQAATAYVVVGQPVKYIVAPLPTLPIRGVFANNLAYISRDEKLIYFGHTSDLVPGSNTQNSYELFSFEISTNKIRQISIFRDGLLQRLDSSQIQDFGDGYQMNFLGASADGKIVAYRRGGFLNTQALSRNASGQYSISRTVSGLTSSYFSRISICN